MNKKEITEIRKLMKYDDCRISRIAGCYVNGERKKAAAFNENFLAIEDEEMHKYCAIAEKVLSGKVGKTLTELEFPREQKQEGGTQESLIRILNEELEDDGVVDAFFDSVIESLAGTGNFLILLFHGNYDIPGKTQDGLEMEDASEDVYSFLLCCICPVEPSNAGLCYLASKDAIIDKPSDWMVKMPDCGFLFPAFNDREMDIHSALYYGKNDKCRHEELIGGLLGCTIPASAEEQKDAFCRIVEAAWENGCSADTANGIQNAINQLSDERERTDDRSAVTKQEVLRILQENGADEAQTEKAEEAFGQEDDIHASSLAEPKAVIVSKEYRISLSGEKAAQAETKEVDGVQCLVIPLEPDTEWNGIKIC